MIKGDGKMAEIITIDLDFKKKATLHEKVMRVLKVLSDCLFQCEEVYIRKSSTGYIHVKTINGSETLRELYDDKSRLKVEELRKRAGLRIYSLLFDMKEDNCSIRKAGEWKRINNFKEAEEWIRRFFRLEY